MLRLKEGGQESIGVEQALARELDTVAGDRQHAIAQVAEPLISPVLENFDAKLLAEVGRVEMSLLQQKDHLAHEQLMLGGPHGAIERQAVALQKITDVVVPLSFVLIMHARHMAEAGHARGKQVRAMPEV